MFTQGYIVKLWAAHERLFTRTPKNMSLIKRAISVPVHSRKRTWIPKMMVWKRELPLKIAILGIYVRFLGCIPPNIPSKCHWILPRLLSRLWCFAASAVGCWVSLSKAEHFPPAGAKDKGNLDSQVRLVVYPTSCNEILYIPNVNLDFFHQQYQIKLWLPVREVSFIRRSTSKIWKKNPCPSQRKNLGDLKLLKSCAGITSAVLALENDPCACIM